MKSVLLCGLVAAIVAQAGPAPRVVVVQRPVHKGARQLEKRCREALKTAGTALRAARDEYQAGNAEGMRSDAARVEQSIDLAYRSLV